MCGSSGRYLEIGAAYPEKYSNTYKLERSGWKGISIELDTQYADAWNAQRTNAIYFADALTFDYANALREHDFPLHINYLSCDIEPAKNTFAALRRVIEQGLTFDCITFEHDLYRDAKVNHDELARAFLTQNGYRVAITDVTWPEWNTPSHIYETWFVRNTIPFTTTTFGEWVNIHQ